jgi:arabinofuranosyltransferase
MIFDSARKHPFVYITLLIFPAAILYGRYVYAPADDAYIFLVYARNFLEGHGLTYNGMLVEGYSSPLWVWMLAILGLSRIPLPALGQLLSTVSGLAALLAAYLLAFRVIRARGGAYIPAVLLVSTGDFVFYMSVGLEEVLFTALVTLCVLEGVYGNNHRRWVLPLLMAIMVLLRPEGLLIAALVLILQAIQQRALARSSWQSLILGISLFPFLAARWLIYRSLLPNTYFAKSGLGLANLHEGVQYMISARTRYGPAALLLVVLFCFALVADRVRARRILPLLVISITWLLYVTAQGGDSLLGGRMYLPVLPLIFTALAALFAHRRRYSASVLLTGALALSLVVGYLGDQETLDRAAQERVLFRRRYDAGHYLRTHFPPETLVALNPAGIIPYYSGMPTIDMLGLNDFQIAHYGRRDPSRPYGHQAGDGSEVLSRSPDIILFGPVASRSAAPAVSDREIWLSSEFQSEYRPVQWPNIGWAYVRLSPAGEGASISLPSTPQPR